MLGTNFQTFLPKSSQVRKKPLPMHAINRKQRREIPADIKRTVRNCGMKWWKWSSCGTVSVARRKWNFCSTFSAVWQRWNFSGTFSTAWWKLICCGTFSAVWPWGHCEAGGVARCVHGGCRCWTVESGGSELRTGLQFTGVQGWDGSDQL